MGQLFHIGSGCNESSEAHLWLTIHFFLKEGSTYYDDIRAKFQLALL